MEPLLDISKTWDGEWALEMRDGGDLQAATLRERRLSSPETGFPTSSPDGAVAFRGPVIFLRAKEAPDYYIDQYTMEWSGSAYGFLRHQPQNMQLRKGPNRIDFAVRRDALAPRRVAFSRVKGEGVSQLRIYRTRYRDLVETGKIWNPRFVAKMREYDVIRTMDFQAINASPVTRFEQVATMDDDAWGVHLQTSWPPPPRYGAPYEALFALAMDAQRELWILAPPMIGAQFHLADPALRKADKPEDVDPEKVRARARESASEILASDEWERFAGAVVDRLIASGYPADRPLYLELGNEIWNTAGRFALHSQYAEGIGAGLNARWGMRQGYGALSARWAVAFTRELKKRGRSQNVTFVLSSQTSWADTTRWAADAYLKSLKTYGEDAAGIAEHTGIALTTYNRCFYTFSGERFGSLSGDALKKEWEEAINADAAALKQELHDFCLSAPANKRGSVNAILAAWRRQAKAADQYGLPILGAYEGGPSDKPAPGMLKSSAIRNFWEDYYWGPLGADVMRQLYRRLLAEHPGVMLSNYVTLDIVGASRWGDGMYDDNTALQEMWREFGPPQTE